MAARQNSDDGEHVEADFAQAFKELARGESTATALENHLDSLEKKIEEMLARAEEEEKNRNPQSKPSADDSAPSGESRPST